MTYHVHIISVGSKSETAFHVIRSGMEIDKIYLLNNDNEKFVEVENEIRKGFEILNLDDIITESIKPFDYDDVFNKILDIYHKESEEHQDEVIFHINFTMGTRITVGAMCSSAYLINADLYYIQEGIYTASGKDELIRIPIDNIKELSELQNKPQTLEVFLRFSDFQPKTNEEIIGSLKSPSNLTYHTNYLLKIGAIQRMGSVRNVKWVLTEKGERMIKRL